MGIGTLLFWGLIITGVVVLVRYLARNEQHGGARPVDRPHRRAGARRAVRRGEIDEHEIDEQEYRRRLDTLRASGSPVSRP